MILLSGASGRVGTAASKILDAANVPFRVLLRDPDKFALKDSSNVEVVRGDLENQSDVERAMSGVSKTLLLMSNNPAQAQIERQFATVAQASGVAHLVKISSMEASTETTATLPKLHYQSEQYIQSLNMAWTFLRPNFYMQNMLMYAPSIKNTGVFALPLAAAQTAMVDARDVGAVVATVLLQEGHQNKIYQLTGDELLSFYDVANKMSEVLGKSVAYSEQTADEFRSVLANFIQSDWQLDAVCDLFVEIAGGSLEHKAQDLERILERRPTSLEDFTQNFAMAF